jgi:hypothetical protein
MVVGSSWRAGIAAARCATPPPPSPPAALCTVKVDSYYIYIDRYCFIAIFGIGHANPCVVCVSVCACMARTLFRSVLLSRCVDTTTTSTWKMFHAFTPRPNPTAPSPVFPAFLFFLVDPLCCTVHTSTAAVLIPNSCNLQHTLYLLSCVVCFRCAQCCGIEFSALQLPTVNWSTRRSLKSTITRFIRRLFWR